MSGSQEPTVPDPVVTPTTEDLRWEKEAQDARHKSLDNVRETATKWTGGVAAILGVASTVTLFAAPNVADLAGGRSWPAILGASLAGLMAVAGLVLGSLAAQGVPEWDMLDGVTLRAHVEGQTPRAISQLGWSRRAIVGSALLLVLTAGGIALAQTVDDDRTAKPVLVVTQSGAWLCGPISQNEAGAVVVAGKTPPGIRQVITVSECPARR